MNGCFAGAKNILSLLSLGSEVEPREVLPRSERTHFRKKMVS